MMYRECDAANKSKQTELRTKTKHAAAAAAAAAVQEPLAPIAEQTNRPCTSTKADNQLRNKPPPDSSNIGPMNAVLEGFSAAAATAATVLQLPTQR
jgi:hypothetical protein